MTTEKKCDFCDKRGLPLLLVRAAVAPHGTGAPLAGDQPISLAAGVAHYTKRLLRSGYVYMFDEARKRWEAFLVTQDGYLTRFSLTGGIVPIAPAKPFNCPDQGHRTVASCIMVSDPKRATKVWIGFSDVLWTEKVRKANDDVAFRKRHMVEVDVQAILGGSNAAPTRPISQLTAVVAEYAMEPTKGKKVFGWSSDAFQARQHHAKDLLQECASLFDGKARIVPVPDPAGIAQDLALLMKHNAETFVARPEYARNLAANAAISQIETAVKKQAQTDELNAADTIANQQVSGNPLGHWLFESTRKQTAELKHVTVPEANRASLHAWQKYTKKFDENARKAWMASFEAALTAYNNRVIVPLARNHVSWMKSTQLANYFKCNYDKANIKSGIGYTIVMTRCIASTQDKNACAKLYDEWLAGSANDETNLLMRAMLFNQKAIGDAVESATTVSISLRQIPWDNIFAVYTNSVDRVREGATDTAARFIVEFGGPVARMLAKVADGTRGFRAAVMATGLIAGHPVVLCEVVGGRKAFRSHIIRQLTLASGQPLDARKMRKAVADELRRQNIHGAPMEGTTKKKWLILAHKDIIAAMPAGLTEQQKVEWVTKTITTVEKVDELNLGRWRQIINTKLGFGVIAGILQAVSLSKVVTDQEKALLNESNDATLRMYAGISTLAATTSEVIGNTLAARAAQGMRFGQTFVGSFGRVLAKSGSRMGLLTGLFVAGLDGYKAYQEIREGADGLVVASYLGSTAVGIGLAFAFMKIALLGAAAIPVIGLLVLLLVSIGILIEFVKDNPIQDWMERCPWGKLKDQHYPNMAVEQAQLKQALK